MPESGKRSDYCGVDRKPSIPTWRFWKFLQEALQQTSIPGDVVQVIPLTDREAITEMLKLEEYIDLVIPRGGEGLIRFVVANSRIPVIKHYQGI